jgi:hypothetical protein
MPGNRATGRLCDDKRQMRAGSTRKVEGAGSPRKVVAAVASACAAPSLIGPASETLHNSRSLATASFALTSRVIAAMVELDKRYAENVGDVVL